MEQMENMAEQAAAGRSTDTVLGHLSLGEIVIPRAMLDDPQVLGVLKQIFEQYGENIAEFTVGDPANKINPETGHPEFFKFKKFLRIAAPIALAAIPGIGQALGGAILGAGATGAATLGNAILGGAAGGLTGGGIKGALTGAALGGIGANIGSAAGVGSTGPTQGSGILGAITRNIPGTSELASGISGLGNNLVNAIGGGAQSITGFNPSQSVPSSALPSGGIMGGTSSSGGGSTYGGALGLASNIYSGLSQDEALKKQRQQLLAANQQQAANLETFDPSNITNDAGYKFNLEQGQQGLDRMLAARGSLFSGQALKAASEYNQQYADNALKDAYQRWANRTGAQNALIGFGGQTQASTTGARASNLSETLSRIVGARSPEEEMLQRLMRSRA